MLRSNGVETRKRILDTAVNLFAKRGTKGVGMRELAEKSDLTLPGLYYHFKSKQALVEAIFEGRGARLRNPHSPRPGATVAQRIKRHAAADLREMQDAFTRLMVLEAISHDYDASALLGSVRESWDARWTKTLAEASDIAPGAKISSAARTVTTTLMGIYLLYICGDEEVSSKNRIEELATTISASLVKELPRGRSRARAV
jgi:AcrR family transcriptional regulator